MKTRAITTFLALIALSGVKADELPLWLACGSAELLRPLEKLAKHRRAQGFETKLSEASPDEAIAACGRPPDFLILVGDTVLGDLSDPNWESPTRTGSLYRWREIQPETFAADALWSDLDNDKTPEFPVGRIPARTAAQVAAVVDKTIAFEQRPYSPADLGLPIWGGTPDIGFLPDELATTGFQALLRRHAPAWAEQWMIFGNPRSTLFADGKSQPDLYNQRIAKGGFITSMVGHGASSLFFSANVGLEEFLYHSGHAAGLADAPPTPPHIILACDCGQFAEKSPSLAEAMLFASGGPVNVVAATTESHPLPNYYSSLAMLSVLEEGHRRFGDLWHACQMRAYESYDPLIETLLKNAEGALEAEIDIPKLKHDQLLMYALLGDPATLLPALKPLNVSVSSEGSVRRWSVEKVAAASALVVQIRRPSSPARAIPAGASAEKAIELFHKKNAAWKFETLATLPPDGDWSGTIKGSGRIRLVAVLPDGLAVATHDGSE